ncbi:aspartate--tRNA ligase [Patescibacteria group bacterium]|nr:aspartate--tRNA ligase [Patescibacteria group bacterium]
MPRTISIETIKKVGEQVKLNGWVHVRRNMGKIVFLDLRDRWGITQVVCVPQELDEKSMEVLKDIRPEFVLEIEGLVQERGEKQINKNLATGTVEVLAKKIVILSKSETPPFEIENEDRQANEELRLKYRYLDLRHERMKKNILLRHEIVRFMREFLYKKDFTEIETPFLSKSTPEGARDFLVPSRNYPGKFYALPQSPQQYKQMLMIAGMEKYFQVVRCFRDEDQRGDRQAEFTQLDLEMSFIEQKEILKLTESLVVKLVQKLLPDYKLTFKPFKKMTYAQAMKLHNSDRPDLREDKNNQNELAFVWVTDFPMFEYKEGDKRWGAAHHPFTAINPKSLKDLSQDKMKKIKALQYDLVLNGNEIAGGSIRTHDPKILHKVFELLGHNDEEIQNKFGHLLEAFKYGVPPHGGIAFGLDRLIMVLANEKSIREVIAFPKTSDNCDPLMDSPSEVSEEQLKELGIEIEK